MTQKKHGYKEHCLYSSKYSSRREIMALELLYAFDKMRDKKSRNNYFQATKEAIIICYSDRWQRLRDANPLPQKKVNIKGRDEYYRDERQAWPMLSSHHPPLISLFTLRRTSCIQMRSLRYPHGEDSKPSRQQLAEK